jgi:hypothetical protein
MIGLLFLAAIIAFPSWFAWLYFASPAADRRRIGADLGGTGMTLREVKRIGTQHLRPELIWVGGHATPTTGGRWYRIYEVTVSLSDGEAQTYCIGVEARLFGLQGLRRIDHRP